MKIGFRAKVLLAITLITVLATFVVGITFLKRSEDIVQENYIKSISGTMAVAIGTMEEYMQQAYNISVALGFDEALGEMLAAYQSGGRDIQDGMRISAYLQQAYPERSLVERIYIYFPETKQMITSLEYHAVQEVFYPAWHAWITTWEEGRKTSLAPALVYDGIRRSPQYTLAYVRPAVYRVGQEETDAILAVSLDERKLFYQCLSTIGLNNSDAYYLVNDKGVIISGAAIGHIGKSIENVLGFAPALYAGNTAEIHGDLLVTTVHSPMTGYRIVGVTSRTELVTQLRNQQSFILSILVLTLLIMLVPAYQMSKQVYKPIERLRQAMHMVSKGDLSARAEIISGDDIAQLSQGFNEMVDQIEGLIDEVIDEQMHKKNAELDALQYQITPHFMYNTLNSIKYAAHLQGAQNIAEQIGAFTELLQASINRKGAFLSVQDEIRMVQNYVKLQQFRYMNSFTVSYEVDGGAEACYVPRLILQPLVENAVLHGQREGGARMHITVSAARIENDLFLSVQDDGKGMTEEQIGRLMYAPKNNNDGFSSIGVYNIKERLRLYYGGKAALRFSSSLGGGTKAVIQLPATEDKDKYLI